MGKAELLKLFSPKTDRLWNIEQPSTDLEYEDWLAYQLDATQPYVDSEEQLKERCLDELKIVAEKKGIGVDGLFSWMKLNYPYSNMSKWTNFSDEVLEKWRYL